MLGLELGDVRKAYAFSELERQNQDTFTDRIGDTEVVVRWNPKARSAHITDKKGKLLPATTSYWFAWFAFFPETQVYEPDTLNE